MIEAAVVPRHAMLKVCCADAIFPFVFGPALPDEEYLGHQPNEYFLISTLMKSVEILTHTMVEFGM